MDCFPYQNSFSFPPEYRDPLILKIEKRFKRYNRFMLDTKVAVYGGPARFGYSADLWEEDQRKKTTTKDRWPNMGWDGTALSFKSV